MGGGNSKEETNITKLENNVYTINKSTVNELNETIQSNTQAATSEIVNANSNQAIAENIVDLKNLKIRTKGNFNIKQGNASAVVFTVQNINNIVSELQSNITNTITNYLKDNLTNDIETDLVNNAVEKINNGFLNTTDAFQFDNSSNKENIQKTINNITTENIIEKNIENIVKLCVDTTINNNIVNQCINNVGDYNKINMEDDEIDIGGNFIIDQSNVIDIAVNCLNNNKLINTITDKLLQITDISVVNDTENTAKTKIEETSIKEENNEGAGDAASKVIDKSGDFIKKTTEGAGNIISNLGNSISGIFSSSIGIFIVIGIVAIFLVIAVAYALTNDKTGQNLNAIGDLAMKVNPTTAVAKSVLSK